MIDFPGRAERGFAARPVRGTEKNMGKLARRRVRGTTAVLLAVAALLCAWLVAELAFPLLVHSRHQ
ncbi:hypothetical protein [Streptomyces sp. ICBB 8177]|uniref:hypothetical protein n=1 Tax=Streptomyces sp. ICBB 8177 TaxID=563922 RepID=UPI0013052850|nr:hypothetical protein [Streptomyces sp. ICBB 8177]